MCEHGFSMKGCDVRAIANLVLEEAEELKCSITNLHLNKALFFMHVDFLQEFGQPLVSAKIEAWEHGPVFREIYNQFKRFRRSAIGSRAKKVDFDSGELIDAWEDINSEVEEKARSLARFYVRIPASVLYDLAHAKGGAWDKVFNNSGQFNVGMEITNELIFQHELKRHERITLQ